MLQFWNLLVVCILLTHGSELNDLAEMAKKLLETGPTNPNTRFEKVYDDVFCMDRPPGFDPPIFTGKVETVKECKARCVSEVACSYMAFWIKTKKCQLYSTCFTQKADGQNRIMLMRRVTSCENELYRYYDLIMKEFPEHVLRPMYIPFEWETTIVPNSPYPNPNFFCRCIGACWMLCGIFLKRGSWEFPKMMERWGFEDTETMKPFFVLGNLNSRFGGERNFLVFADTPPKAIAEMQVIEHLLDDEVEKPGCIHISQCIRGVPNGKEPLQKRPFQSGEPVYLLGDDILRVGTNLPVTCITVQAMRSWIIRSQDTTAETEGFRDPLGRTLDGRERMNVKEDYTIVFMFDELAMSTGICSDRDLSGELPRESEQFAPGPADPDTSGLSTELEELDLSPDEPGPSKAVRKASRKKKGKKKVSSSQAGPSQAGPSSSDMESFGEAQSLPASLMGSPILEASSPASEPRPESLPSDVMHSGSPEAAPERLKVVLSKSDVDKLKRSFQEAKARREKGGPSQEEHVSETLIKNEFDSKDQEEPVASNSTESFHKVLPDLGIFCGFLMLLSWCFPTSTRKRQDAYLEFQDEI